MGGVRKMFEDAASSARKYTFPVFSVYRTQQGKTRWSVGAFVVLNRDGWVLTTARIAEFLPLAQQQQHDWREYQRSKSADGQAHRGKPKRKTDDPQVAPPAHNRVTAHTMMVWAIPGAPNGILAQRMIADRVSDLAVVQLAPFDPGAIEEYPILRPTVSEVPHRCPLYYYRFLPKGVHIAFNKAKHLFDIEIHELPMLASAGIQARDVLRPDPIENRTVKLIDILGDGSAAFGGAPVLDEEGHLCGLQTGTTSFDCDFLASMPKPLEETCERDTLKYVRATGASAIVDLLGRESVDHKYAGELSAELPDPAAPRHSASSWANGRTADGHEMAISVDAARKQLGVSLDVMNALVVSGLLGPALSDRVSLVGLLEFDSYGTQWRSDIGDRHVPHDKPPVIPGPKGGTQPDFAYSQARIAPTGVSLDKADADTGWLALFYLRANRYYFPNPMALALTGPLHLRLECKREVVGAPLPTWLFPDQWKSLTNISVIGNPGDVDHAFETAYDIVAPLLDELSYGYDQPLHIAHSMIVGIPSGVIDLHYAQPPVFATIEPEHQVLLSCPYPELIDAVALYREAMSDSNPFHQFLAFWRVYESAEAVRVQWRAANKRADQKLEPEVFPENVFSFNGLERKPFDQVRQELRPAYRNALAHGDHRQSKPKTAASAADYVSVSCQVPVVKHMAGVLLGNVRATLQATMGPEPPGSA